MFTSTLMGHYIPLTWMSFGLNYVLGGMNPWGYHLVNLLLHASNAVNFVVTRRVMLAYITVGGLNEVQVFRTTDFVKVATIPVGKLPHGIWPSGDGTRINVGLENDDGLAAIDTASNTVTATVRIGQAPQALTYVPNAVPEGAVLQGLQPLDVAGRAAHLFIVPVGYAGGNPPTSVALVDQGLLQVLQAAVTGLEPRRAYVLALSTRPDGGGVLSPLAAFTTNPAGAAVVNALGPIRQIVQGDAEVQRRYLVIAPGTPGQHGAAVQVQAR